MKITTARIKGLLYVLWHARHELYHVLLGLVWAWVLREIWNELNAKWIILAIFGSLLPDAEHILYFISYGRKDSYTKDVVAMLRNRQWRSLTTFIETGHKYNTNLAYHNIYTIIGLFAVSYISFLYEWRSWIVITGAMIIHYLFDIADDLLTLGYINSNWKRWGNGKKKRVAQS